MKDRLEDFVKDHNAEFDLHEPNPELWKGIKKEIARNKEWQWRFYLSRAAIVILIFGASFAAQRLWLRSESKIAKQTDKMNIEIPELREAEIYYTGVIDAKLREAKPMLSKFPSLEKELHIDLFELDSINKCLKNDLQDNIANQEVIEAMIQNYRLRISILEDMLTFLESQNSNDTTNSTEYDL
jgi:hypothetical protein